MEQLIERLSELTDTRRQWGNLRHKLVDIVFIGLVSVICGGTDFEHMEDTGYGKEEWFRERLELPNGIPDSDTFRRVFERLNPKELAEILQETVDVEGKVLAIDGKTICGSANNQHRAYHVISAWVAENQITLGQLAVAQKSNEITAIPELLDMLDILGSTVTIDAMGCQKQIAVTSHTDIDSFAHAVRSHWSIESQLHWQLDVTFHEDGSRARKDNSPLNLNVLRKEALRLLNQADFGKRVSIRRKMSRAAMDNVALDHIIAQK